MMMLTSLLLLGIPLVLLGSSLADQVGDIYHAVEDHMLAIKPPNTRIAELPLVGERIYSASRCPPWGTCGRWVKAPRP